MEANRVRGHAWALVLVGCACVLGLAIDAAFAVPDLSLVFLPPIMASAAWWGRGPSTLAAATSVAAFDYFFVAPRFTLAVAEPRYLITFSLMLGVGLVISAMASRLREQRRAAAVREAKTEALYALGADLSTAASAAAIASALLDRVRKLFACEAVVLAAPPNVGEAHASRGRCVATALAERHTVEVAGAVAVPLVSGESVYGVLLVTSTSADGDAELDVPLLEGLARQAAAALARTEAAEIAAAADRRARTEEARSTLLSAVSHDLRTPLAVIGGAASTVRNPAIPADQREELLATICDEAERLDRLVGNLLDMTRLHAGDVSLRGQWVPPVEVVGSALARLETRLGARRVDVELDPELPLVWIDPVLLETALVNLVENALVHGPSEQPITIVGRASPQTVTLGVHDRGPGLPTELGARVFEKFVRGRDAGRGGFGLGLAICREIAAVHGGTIEARPRAGGGTSVEITLPRRADEPSAEVDPQLARELA